MGRARLSGNRDCLLLWGGEKLSEIGSQSSTVAYPLLVLALTGSPTQSGIVGLAKWLPVALFALPAGVLADAVDRKRLMIICDAVRLLGACSIVLALVVGRPLYSQIVIVAGGVLFSAARVLPFIADAGSFILSMTALAATKSRFQIPVQTRRPSLRNVRSEMGESVAWLRGQPCYRTAALLFAAGNPVYTGLR
jgi:MFS family permease